MRAFLAAWLAGVMLPDNNLVLAPANIFVRPMAAPCSLRSCTRAANMCACVRQASVLMPSPIAACRSAVKAAAKAAGAHGCTISGAGPTCVAVVADAQVCSIIRSDNVLCRCRVAVPALPRTHYKTMQHSS